MGRKKKYLTEEERKEAQRENSLRYIQKHRAERAEYSKQWYLDNIKRERGKRKQYSQEHKEERTEYFKQYRQTQMGRACCLVNDYKRNDKLHNRGECTLTPEWVVENIFSQPCRYCGKTDWTELGCDRIDNDLPHTPDNVVPCCEECNKKRGRKSYEEFLLEMLEKKL